MSEALAAVSRAHAIAPLDLLAGLTLLALLPFALVTCTSFVRIVVVLSLVRSAIGASALPPNAVLSGCARADRRRHVADAAADSPRRVRAVRARSAPAVAALARAAAPLEAFMLRQARVADVELFDRIARRPLEPVQRVPSSSRSGVRRRRTPQRFAIGFALYLPFVAIDLAVAAILMGLGMVMLDPPVVSLPVKLRSSSWSTVGRWSAEA